MPKITFLGARRGPGQRTLVIAVLLILVVSLGWLGLKGMNATQDKQTLEQQLGQLTENNAAKQPATASPKKSSFKSTQMTLGKTLAVDLNDDTRRNINTVIRQLNTPWQDLFNKLERLTPADVALLSIEPDALNDTLKLQAEAKTLNTLLLYAAGLEQQGLFGRLTYSKHETNDQDPNKPIRLSFELEVRPLDRVDVVQETQHSPTVPQVNLVSAKRANTP